MPRAVALFSGGLDSMLAIRALQEQGLEVDALNVRTIFDCRGTPATQADVALGVRTTVLSVADDYLDVIRRPTYGYGRGVNPCVDCRIYMCKMAKRFMEEVGACVVVTGEILGQRPMSQKRRDLRAIEQDSGLEGRLLRPLSAKLLPPTIPEREGLIDREKLYDFTGRARRPLIELARQLGIREIRQPSTGCALTEVTFSPRVRDLIQFHPDAGRWDFELLNLGRHVRYDERTKVVVGRNAEENARLRHFFSREDARRAALLRPENFAGPEVLIVGRLRDRTFQFAGALLFRYSRHSPSGTARLCLDHWGTTRSVTVRSTAIAEAACLL